MMYLMKVHILCQTYGHKEIIDKYKAYLQPLTLQYSH